MKKTVKKFISLTLCLAMLFGIASLISVNAESPALSGTCGENLTWELDPETGNLHIDGTGDMENYEEFYMPKWTRNGLPEIKTVTIGNGVTTLGHSAFLYCQTIESITFEENSQLREIGHLSMAVNNLTEINIPDSVVSIWSLAFHGTQISEIDLPDGAVFYHSAFDNCANLTKINISENHKYYSTDENGVIFNKDKSKLYLYLDAKPETEYTIPASVTSIEDGAFNGAVNLEHINFEENSKLEVLSDYCFNGCNSVSEIILPDNLKKIGVRALSGLNIKEIDIPDGVTEIGAGAFNGCPLRFVEIPDSVTSLPNGVFEGCGSIIYMHIPESVTEIDDNLWSSRYGFNTPPDYICSDTENCYAKTFAESKGVEFKVCGGEHPQLLYTATFDPNGGVFEDGSTEPISRQYYYNDYFSSERPQKEGYTLDYWVDDEGNHIDATRYDSYPGLFRAYMPMRDITYTAHWVRNLHYLWFEIEGNTIGKSARYTEEIPLPTAEEIGNYEIIDWVDEDGNSIDSYDSMPDRNITFRAVCKYILSSDEHGITASYDTDCFDIYYEFVELDITEITDEQSLGGVYCVEDETYYQTALYNIKMVDWEGKPIQPKEGKTVKIRIPVPEKFADRDDFLVLHRFSDEGREMFSTADGTLKIENGYIVFETSHFSEFEVCVKSENKVSKLPRKTSYSYKANSVNIDGIELKIANDDGTYTTVTDTSEMEIISFNTSEIGEQTVILKCRGEYFAFNINITYAWWQWIIRILFLGFLWY